VHQLSNQDSSTLDCLKEVKHNLKLDIGMECFDTDLNIEEFHKMYESMKESAKQLEETICSIELSTHLINSFNSHMYDPEVHENTDFSKPLPLEENTHKKLTLCPHLGQIKTIIRRKDKDSGELDDVNWNNVGDHDYDRIVGGNAPKNKQELLNDLDHGEKAEYIYKKDGKTYLKQELLNSFVISLKWFPKFLEVVHQNLNINPAKTKFKEHGIPVYNAGKQSFEQLGALTNDEGV